MCEVAACWMGLAATVGLTGLGNELAREVEEWDFIVADVVFRAAPLACAGLWLKAVIRVSFGG